MKISVSKVGVWKTGSPPATVLNNWVRDYIYFTTPPPGLNRAYFDAPPIEVLHFVDPVPNALFGNTIRDLLHLIETVRTSGNVDVVRRDTISFQDFLLFSIDEIVSDTITFGSAEKYRLAVLLALSEVLELHPRIDVPATFTVLYSEVLQFGDASKLSFEGSILDQLGLRADIMPMVAAMLEYTDALTLFEATNTASFALMLPPVTDELTLGDDQTNQAAVREVLRNVLQFGIRFRDGEDSYAGWALNTRVFGASTATGMNFNSLFKAGNALFGASDGGLYRTGEGEDINPIMTTGLLELANGRQTRVPHLYLGVLSDAKIVVKTVTGEGVERWYESATPAGGVETLRTVLGRKPAARLWQFSLIRQPGTKFDLSRIEMYPVILRRRTPNVR
jgi:hypothetical protein